MQPWKVTTVLQQSECFILFCIGIFLISDQHDVSLIFASLGRLDTSPDHPHTSSNSDDTQQPTWWHVSVVTHQVPMKRKYIKKQSSWVGCRKNLGVLSIKCIHRSCESIPSNFETPCHGPYGRSPNTSGCRLRNSLLNPLSQSDPNPTGAK